MTSPCVSLETLENLVLDKLSATERLALLGHLGTCPACNLVVSEVLVTTATRRSGARASDAPFKVGDAVGRYVLSGLLGAGATGTVYRAHDAMLGRDVAMKVLRELATEQGLALLDEARALAKVTHQNVVPLYEVGTHAGHPFLVMQLVDGGSLQQWLKQPRAWREVAQRFLDAARGLAAVHDAGFIHGDFKPANVLVDTKDQVRVVDFGFGRPAVQGEDAADTEQRGTPAYMAPELFAGEAPGADSDQFSFFVAFYEGLFQTRPFPGGARETVTALLEGRPPTPPSGKVPRWLTRLVVRGLGPRGQRYASMNEVVARLSSGLAAPRRLSTWAVAATVVAGALAVGLWSAQRTSCGDVGALAEVWNPARSARIRAAFEATGLPFAAASFESVRQHLDQAAEEWTAMDVAACEASRAGRQSARLTELQQVCLSGRREAWRGFVESLENADAERVVSSVSGVAALPAVAPCADLERLGATLPLPADTELAARVANSQSLSAQAALQREARQLPRARELAQQALAVAADAGYPPAVAAAQYQLGAVLLEQGHAAEGVQALKDAAWQAERSGELEVTVTAAMALMRFQASTAQLEEALTWQQHAATALERLRQPPLLTGHFESAAGFVSFFAGRNAEALTHDREAIRLLSPRLGPSAAPVLQAQVQLADALRRTGEYEEALSVAQATFRTAQEAWGDQHPASAQPLRAIASAESRLGRYADAAEHYRATIELLRRAWGSQSRRVASELVNLGNQYLWLNRGADALAAAEEAIDIGKQLSFDDVGVFLDARVTRAEALVKLGRHDEAIEQLRDVIARKRALKSPDLASDLDTLAGLLAAQKRWDDATALYRESLSLKERADGAAHPGLIWNLNGLARCAQGLKQWEASVPLLRRALALGEATKSHPDRLADTRFLLARGLAHADPDSAEALQLAQQAELVFRDFPESAPQLLEARAWLAAHRRHAAR